MTDLSGTDAVAHHRLPRGTWLLPLCMDGGGIYGLFAATWLRQMCERNEDFLRPSHDGDARQWEFFFSGCSAGAVSALVLASHANPRDACLPARGERYSALERLWRDDRMYTNRLNPVDSALSKAYITPMIGETDTLQLLEEVFGDTKMGQLHHRVVISTYNWHGEHPLTFPPRDQPRDWPPNWSRPHFGPPGTGRTLVPWQHLMNPFAQRSHIPWFKPGMSAMGAAWMNRVAATPSNRRYDPVEHEGNHAGPLLITNFLAPEDEEGRPDPDGDCPELEYDVVDVAYGSVSMPPARSIRGGIGDGAVFTPNPAVDCATAILRHVLQQPADIVFIDTLEDELKKARVDDLSDKVRGTFYSMLVGAALWRVKMLSLGCATRVPPYWIRDTNYGALPYMMAAQNPWQSGYAPNWYSMNQAIEDVEDAIRVMLGPAHYHRLDPDLMELPVGASLQYVADDKVRSDLLREIDSKTRSKESKSHVAEASDWAQTRWPPNHPCPTPREIMALTQRDDFRMAMMSALKKSEEHEG